MTISLYLDITNKNIMDQLSRSNMSNMSNMQDLATLLFMYMYMT